MHNPIDFTITEKEEHCWNCGGTGQEWDEHPHNGSRMGDSYSCTKCKGKGKYLVPITLADRVSRIEEWIKSGILIF